jgi:hypothetical protein
MLAKERERERVVEAYSERNVHPGTIVSGQTSVTLNSVHVMIFIVCLLYPNLKKYVMSDPRK